MGRDNKAIMNKLKELGKTSFSYSALSKLLVSPDEFTSYLNKEFKGTPATELGKAFHSLLLEPDTFEKDIFIWDENERPEPTKTFASKANKQWKAEKMEEIEAMREAGLTVITAEQSITISNMIAKSYSTATVDLFKSGTAEEHITKEVNNLSLHGYIDYNDLFSIIDVKTYGKRINQFQWDIKRNNYDLQAYVYSLLTDFQKEYYIYAIETTNHHDIALIKLSEDIIESGRQKFERAITNFENWFVKGKAETYYLNFEF